MKIVYVYSALTTVGGADRVITEKANYFARKCGYDVYIITAHQNGVPIFFELDDKVKHIDINVDFNEQYPHSLFMRSLIYIKLQLRYKKRLALLLESLRADFVITTISRDIDFLTSIKDGSIKIAETHISKKYIRSLHLMRERSLPYRIIADIWTKKLEKAIKKFSSLVVLTEDDARNWAPIVQAKVIPNSLPFYPAEKSLCENKKIISIGRLEYQKGFDILLETWSKISSKYPDWKIYIYGNGELQYQLRQDIQKKGLTESFIIKSPVKNIVDKYLDSSFYVMSSRFEGFGMVLAEAMACGIPCISFNCPNGPSDIIKDNIDGFLVEYQNIDKLAEKISFLIENEETRKEMGTVAKENIKRYSADNVMSKWISLFEELKKN